MSASSAVAGAIAVIPSTDGSGPTLSGGGITANTVIKTQTVTLGSNTSSGTSAATGLKITNVYVTDSSYNILDDTALGSSGGYLKIVGTGFKTGCAAYINGSSLTTTFVSSTQINIVVPSQSVGVYSLMIFNTDGNGAIYLNLGVSNFPTFTTSAGSLGTVYETTGFTQTIAATGDTPFVYSLYSGTLPSGATLNANGAITGTSQVESGSNTYSFVVNVKDAQNQDTQRSFSLTINTDVVSWSSPANNTIYNLTGGTIMGNVTLSATSAAGYNISYAANTLPTGVSLSGNTIYGTPTTAQTIYTELTATAATTNRSAKQYISWSVQLGDPQFNYTTLLLNGETSVTPFIADASTNNFPLTIAGDTRADKFSPYYGDGYYSNYFNGSTDYLSLPSNISYAGDFTIECWMYASGSAIVNYASIFGGNSGGFVPVYALTGNKLECGIWGSSAIVTSTGTFNLNQWNHIALVRSGSAIRWYINGVQDTATATNSSTLSQTGPVIGTNPTAKWTGYISNLRVVNGTALYTANFTPSTTPLTAVANTSLLTCQSNRFIDKSTNAFTVTPTGAPKISPAIPFAASSSYATYGSQYSLTTASYSTVSMGATQAFGTGDFTVECWVYNTATAHNLSMAATSTTTWELLTYGSQLYWHENGGNLGGTGYGTIALNTWSHFAVSRASGTLKMFINGVQVYSATNTYNYNNNSTARSIGPNNGGTAGQYISDFRVINGTGLYTSAFTPPTAPLTAVANTQLLTLQYNGGANNYGIIDNGPFNNIITRAGNATQGTFSPYSQTGWSNYFTTADAVSVPSATWTTLAGTFTIEFWVNFVSSPSANPFIGVQGSGGFNIYNDGTRLTPNVFGTGNIFTSSALLTTIGTGKWNHISITRDSSNVMTMWLNGVNVGSATTSSSYTQGIWKINNTTFNCNISNFRVTNTCLYTTTFTPSTTPLTAISGTSLLTCQSNRIIDNSSNNFALTVTGTPSVQAFSPFSPGVLYTPATNGGSAYFDGTGDYLSITDNPPLEAGAATVTIECWIYPTAAVTGGIIAKRTDTSAAYGSIQLTRNSAGTLVLLVSYTGSSWAVNSSAVGNTPINQWSHVAVTKNSSSVWQIWINGTAVYTSSAQVGSVVDNTTAWTIGCMATDLTSPFTGYISDFRYVIGSAVYTSTFTPPTSALTVLNSTALLLNFTNGGIVDAHSSNVLETVGGAQLSTAVKKFGSASMYFGGSGAYCYASTNALYAFGTGDFTIEAWIYRLDTGVQRAIVDTRGAAAVGVLFYITTNNVLNAFDSTSVYISSTGTVPANQWVHVAMTRNGTNTKLFINGTVDGSITNDTRNYTNGAGGLLVGRQFGSTSNDWNGYLDDPRITKGYARYTANFTPPTSGLLAR